MNFRQVCRWLPLFLLSASMGLSSFSYSQQKISGKVNDENSAPLAGVTIAIKGSSTGTSTDENGNFTITIPATSSVLVVSYQGYLSREITPGNNTTLSIQLLPDVKRRDLNEVVVVGYGTQRKVDLTGSVASVTRKEIVNKPFSSPDQILGGRVPGVNITNRSGDPGAPIDVRIRGIGTPGTNQPLWVIDGVPIVQTSNVTVNTSSSTETNPLAGINTNDIESIDVLKDASASAIYGARAANGVIIVTTRRGREGKTSLTYDGYYGQQFVPKDRYLDVLNVEQYIAFQSELGRDFSAFASQPYVDWQDAMFHSAATHSHNLTINGGTAKATYNIGAGFMESQGVEIGQSFRRLSLKVNSDIQANKYMRFGESILISSVNRLTQSEGNIFGAYTASLNAPYFKIYDPNGPLGYTMEIDENKGEGATGNNQVWKADLRVNETRIFSKKMLGSIYGELEPISGLKYKLTLGADYNVGDGYYFQDAADFGSEQRGSTLVQERPLELTTNLSQTLTYNKKFGLHDLTALIGHEETSFQFNKMRIQGNDLFNVAIRLPSVANSVASANEADHWAIRGLLARVFYSYNDRYLFTFNVRRDATSRFSEDNRSGTFPSFSAGWRLSEEEFMKNQKLFTDLKIRASWGESGNQFTGQNFSYLNSLATTIFYVIGAEQRIVRGPAPVIFANSNLKWERSAQTDIGFDALMLAGKLEITFDYFNKETNDVLLSLPIPFATGYFLPADANLGKIKNTGAEISANYRNSTGNFRYSIGGNFTTVKNNVVSLGDIPEIITGVSGQLTHRTTTGEPLGYFYGYKTDGIYQNQKEVDEAIPDNNSSGPEPGDVRFVDVNNDGTVDAGDRTYIGKSIPDFYYGINLSGAYKGFDLSIFFQGVGGTEVYNDAGRSLRDMSSGNNQATEVLNRWKGEGTSNSIPRSTVDDPNGNNRYSDRWIEDGSFMRIKNIQLGYTFPSNKLSSFTKQVISGSRIYIGVNNLATFTKYKGYDPEVTRGVSFQKGEFALANGQDSGGSPQPTIAQLGWSITF